MWRGDSVQITSCLILNSSHGLRPLHRRDDVRIEEGFEIADQQPDLIAQDEPDTESKYNQDQDCQGNFNFAHSQEIPPARNRGNNPRMIAKHQGYAQL